MRCKQIEYAILKLIVKHPDPAGRAFTLGGLGNLVVQDVPDVSDEDLVNATKRLWRCGVLEPCKYNSDTGRFDSYQGTDDERFFWSGEFRLRETPHTQPYLERLEREVGPEPERPKIGF